MSQELENNFIETLQALRGIIEAVKRQTNNNHNTKLQSDLKGLITNFKTELEKGNTIVPDKLQEFKDKAIKLAKDNNIEWSVCKEYKPQHHRDSVKSTLDTLIDKAKSQVSTKAPTVERSVKR